LHRKDKGWIIPFLLWLFIAIRIITFYVPISLVMRPVRTAWKNTAVRGHDMIPAKFRKPAAAAVTVVVILIGAFVSKESADNTRANRAVSLFGLAVMIAVLYATSRNRSKVGPALKISNVMLTGWDRFRGIQSLEEC
jgi:concentrative nucleoside transporter, CNT family